MSTFAQLKRNEREARREIIISAARRIFEKKPFHEIGIRDIASEAGVAPASIYRYFPSRDELFVETLSQEITRVEEQFKAQLRNGGTDLDEVALAHIDYLLDNEATFQLMCHFMTHRQIQPETMEKFNQVQRQFFNMLDNVMPRQASGVKVRILSHAYYAAMTGVVMAFRNYPGREKEEIRRHIHRLALLITDMFKQSNPDPTLPNNEGPNIRERTERTDS